VVAFYRKAVVRMRTLRHLPYVFALRGRRLLHLLRRLGESKRRVRLPRRIVT